MKDSTTLLLVCKTNRSTQAFFPRAVEMALGETECAQRPESAGRFRGRQAGRFGSGKAGQSAGGDEEGQRVGDRFDGILSAQLQGAVDRHQDRLCKSGDTQLLS